MPQLLPNETMSTSLSQQSAKPSALRTMAGRLNVEADSLLSTLKATVCKGCTDPEVMAFSIVANEYNLNPFIKHIYAFPAKGGGIVPVVSVDGWITMTNNHPQMDGIEFEDTHDANGNLVSIACNIWRKDRNRPIKITEYYDECKRPTDPWKMPHRMLRHKALIQCARVAFGFSGIVDEDEADEIARNGGMREVSGRVVPPENPLSESKAEETTVSPEPKRQRAAKPAPQSEAPPTNEDASATQTSDPEMPDRQTMVADIKESWSEAGIKLPEAEACYRKAGLLADDEKMATLPTERLFTIWKVRCAALVEGFKPEGQAA